MKEMTSLHTSNTDKQNTTLKATQKQMDNKESDMFEKTTIDLQETSMLVDKLNEFIDPLITNLKFVLHEDLNEYYVTVVNPLTDEVIKEIPPKKMLDMYAAMAEFMGILIDEKR